MYYAIDLGGSTIDGLSVMGKEMKVLPSLESAEIDKSNIPALFEQWNIDFSLAEKIVCTGGRSRLLPSVIEGVPLIPLSEIDAIGAGGIYLSQLTSGFVCSLGTGTCFVSVENGVSTHVGGTGMGGGTFFGLCRASIGTDDFPALRRLASHGNLSEINLSVEEITGAGIGIVPPHATASHFAKAHYESSPEDIVCGIAQLVGQSIASQAVSMSRITGHQNIILGGKLVRLPQIRNIFEETAQTYGKTIIIPDNASYISAFGAGVLGT